MRVDMAVYKPENSIFNLLMCNNDQLVLILYKNNLILYMTTIFMARADHSIPQAI